MTSRALAGGLLALFLLAGNARSTTITKHIVFDRPSIVRTIAGAHLDIKGCRALGVQGEPILPVYAARFIIPQNESAARVIVTPEGTVALDGSYTVAAMPPQLPVGAAMPASWARNEAVYRSSSPYPASWGVLVTQQTIAGIRIAFVNVYPCQIVPASGTVLFAPSVRVDVETVPSPDAVRSPSPTQVERALRAVKRLVENPEDAAAYERAPRPPEAEDVSGELAQYVIITSSQFVSSFQPLADLKTRMGLRTRIVDTGWILSNFSGADTQEKVRNFIKYAYVNWQTEYVLLGGDDDIIPHRGFYVKFGTTVDTNIPSDLYYACLDGNWNTDGDAYFGEPGEEDLLPEVTVGRLPVDSEQEIANAIHKIVSYSLAPVVCQCTSALMLGELLWSIGGVNTYGCDYKDEILYGSSNFGMTTAGIPSSFTRMTLYDRDLGSWGKAQLLPILNAGVNLVNHLGHSSLLSVMRLANTDIPLLTNDGAHASYFVCYSQGCYAASFDNRDDAGVVHAEDCIGEDLVTGPNGAAAFVGNTRLGWDAPYTTCGVSQFFDRRFFDALFGEGIVNIGDALDDSRLDNISSISFDGVRWVYYEMCLLGDPAMPVWTAAPRTLSVAHDSVLYAGQGGFAVTVGDEAGPVAGAAVNLSSTAPNIYCTSWTDGAGRALLKPGVQSGGFLLLSIVSANHVPYCDTIPVGNPPPYLASIDSLTVRDGSGGMSLGGGVSAEPGETIALAFALNNLGQNPLHNIVVTVSSPDSNAVIRDSTRVVGCCAAGSRLVVNTAFTIQIGLFARNGERLPIVFRVVSDEGSWRIPETITIRAADAFLESVSMTDAPRGNGNGCIEAWEFENIVTTWRNRGAVDILSPYVTLSFPNDSWGRAVKTTVTAPLLQAGTSLAFPGELLWFVEEFTPPFTDITMFLTLAGENVAACTETLRVTTCGTQLDAAADLEAPLTHRAIAGADQWHLSTERYHSGPTSWKCGGSAGAAYANLMESALVLPPMCLYTGSSMTFWHRMNAELGTVSPYWALDAGVIELSQNGGKTWTILTPATQYPSRASPYNSIFLAAYQRCYSGSFDWRKETVDLSSYRGPVLIRFHFASDEQYGFEGWYIDDIHVSTQVPTDVPRGGTPAAVQATRLEPVYPNPFNPSTVIPFAIAARAAVRVAIFDVSGRRVRMLLDAVRDEGRYTLVWDGKNDHGRPLASGVYLCRLTAGAYSATERLVLVR